MRTSQAMTDRELLQIPLPTFDNWASFSVGQLEALLVAWEWIRDHPDWAMWREGAKTFVRQIEAELDGRAQERSRLALQREIANWGVANDRAWGNADARAAADAVERLLSHWGDDRL